MLSFLTATGGLELNTTTCKVCFYIHVCWGIANTAKGQQTRPGPLRRQLQPARQRARNYDVKPVTETLFWLLLGRRCLVVLMSWHGPLTWKDPPGCQLRVVDCHAPHPTKG